MESDSSSGKIMCVLCNKELNVRRDSGTLITKAGTMCFACGTEYANEQSQLEDASRINIDNKLRRWVTKMKTVKRFYRRQHNLPLAGGEE